MDEDKIKHEGFIKEITPQTIFVCIVAQSACGACHAKGFCNVSGNEEKIIEVKNTLQNEHKQGDRVIVTMEQKMGIRAVLWSYFFPLLLMLSTLIIVFKATNNEGFSGLAAIVILVPYFFALYFFRNKLKSAFEFRIETI